MATTSVVSSGLASIAPELKPFYLGTGTKGQADFVPGLLDKGQEVYGQNYQQQIGNQLQASGLGGAGRVAGLSQMEQQLGQSLQNMQTPGQFGAGTNLATSAGQGQLGTTGQAAGYGQMGAGFGTAGVGLGQQAASLAPQATVYGQQGVGYGAQAADMAGMGFGAGQRFEGMATDPRAQQAFMSPYMQNVVDFQKQQAIRDYDIAATGRNAQAVGAGAFGGSRQAVFEGEANRALMNQLGGIQATGTQKAFEDAQKQMQFGSQLGLQGLQAGYQGLQTGIQGAQTGLQGLAGAQDAYRTGLQGTAQGIQGAQTGLQGVNAQQAGFAGANAAASTLGQLGTQQQAAEMDRLSAQGAFGALQRGVAQQGIDAQYSDLMNQLNYSKGQLTGMQGLLTGTPTANMSSTQSTTTPAPSFASQLGGAGLSGLALYQMFNKG